MSLLSQTVITQITLLPPWPFSSIPFHLEITLSAITRSLIKNKHVPDLSVMMRFHLSDYPVESQVHPCHVLLFNTNL